MMNKHLLIAFVALIALTGSIAHGATIRNLDKEPVMVNVKIGRHTQSASLRQHESFDSKSKDASFRIGKSVPVMAKSGERFVVKDGKILPEKEAGDK